MCTVAVLIVEESRAIDREILMPTRRRIDVRVFLKMRMVVPNPRIHDCPSDSSAPRREGVLRSIGFDPRNGFVDTCGDLEVWPGVKNRAELGRTYLHVGCRTLLR